MPTQVIIHSGMLSLIDERRVSTFKVCMRESPTVSRCRRERVGSRIDSPYRDTPTGSPSHTHTLRSQAELSCFNTDLPPTVEETVHRYEIVAF